MADVPITRDGLLALERGRLALGGLAQRLAGIFGGDDLLTMVVDASKRGLDDLLFRSDISPSDREWVARELDAEAEHLLQRPQAIAAAQQMLAALRSAEQFIVNGVEFGFIRMPDPGTPDPAHDTLPSIRAAIANAEGRP